MSHGGFNTGETIGKLWRKSRFLTPYLRNVLWEHGYAVDTLETALPWLKFCQLPLLSRLYCRNALERLNQRAWVFAHLSHVYTDGASIYVTYIFPRAVDPDETLSRWTAMKTAASQVVLAHHGTRSATSMVWGWIMRRIYQWRRARWEWISCTRWRGLLTRRG